MKVAHLIDTLSMGGAQKLLVDFADEAVPRGLDVLVIVLRKTNHPASYSVLLEKSGARVKFLSIVTLFDLSAVPQLIKILKDENVDTLHTHLSHANILGGIAGFFAGIPVVSTLHNVRSPSMRNTLGRFVAERMVLRFFTKKVIAVGNTVAKTQRPYFSDDKLRTVPNPVNRFAGLSEKKIEALRQEISGKSCRKIALTTGRLIMQKGYTEMITAFAKVHNQHPDAVLAFAGDGYMRDELEKLAVSLGLNGSVRFLGYRKDILSLLGASDLYVNSSHWEGLSVAMLEALSAGLPVLATSVGDAPYLLAEGRGVLVPPSDIEAFAREFSSLLDDPKKRRVLGEKGRAYVEKNYSVEAWLDSLMEIYIELTGETL